MKMTISKKFKIDTFDLVKSAAVTGIMAGVSLLGSLIEEWMSSPSFDIHDINLKLIVKVSFGTGLSYLVKNFLSGPAVIAKPETEAEKKDLEKSEG